MLISNFSSCNFVQVHSHLKVKQNIKNKIRILYKFYGLLFEITKSGGFRKRRHVEIDVTLYKHIKKHNNKLNSSNTKNTKTKEVENSCHARKNSH